MTSPSHPPTATRWWTLAVVSVSTFMLMLDLSVVAIALPSIHNSLNASFSQMQWVYDAYALTLAAFLVTAGSVADRTGRKRLFLIGLVVFTAASLACGLAGSINVLDVSRGVQGVGAAIMFAVGPALLGHEFHGKQRALAFSAFGGAIGLAVAGGPLIGGALTSGAGWRWLFYLNVPIGIVALLVALWRLRESRMPGKIAPDYLGMVAFTVALAAIVLAVTRGNTDGWFAVTNVALYVVSAVFFVAFLLIARSRGDRAMFQLSLFRNRTFLGLAVMTLLANAGGFPMVFLETTYLQGVLNSTAWEAGLRFLPLTLGMFVLGAVAGGAIGKVPFRAMLSVAMVVLGIALLLTHRGGAYTSWTALAPSMALAGAAFGIVNPTRAALAIALVEPERAGVASGISETCQQTGIALGIAIGGAFFQNRVTAAFGASSAGAHLGGHAAAVSASISTGAIDATARSVGNGLTAQVAAAGREAFASAFHDTMTLCAVLAFVAAVVALLMLRQKDVQEGALTGIPPEVPETVPEEGEAVPVR